MEFSITFTSKSQSWVKLVKDFSQLGTVQSIKSVYRSGKKNPSKRSASSVKLSQMVSLSQTHWQHLCLFCHYVFISYNFSEATLLPETVANGKFTGVIRLVETSRNFTNSFLFVKIIFIGKWPPSNTSRVKESKKILMKMHKREAELY